MTTDPTPNACTLAPADRPRRERQARSLAERCSGAHVGAGEAWLAFRGGSRRLLEAFVADEVRCCPFFGFQVADRAGDVELAVTAPPAAQALLEGLVASLAGGAPLPPTPR